MVKNTIFIVGFFLFNHMKLRIFHIRNSLLILLIFFLPAIHLNGQQCLPNLDPSFTYTISNNGCGSPSIIDFTNTSTGAQATSSTYYWRINFMVFDTTTGLTPPSSLSRYAGNHSIVMIAVSPTGCKDTFIAATTIVPKPQASFTISPSIVCRNTTAYFTNTSSNRAPGVTWLWEFGDGATSSSGSTVITHTYGTNGIYYVKLTMINKAGCRDSVIHTLTVAAGSSPIRFYDDRSLAKNYVQWRRCVSTTSEPDSFRQEFVPADTIFNYTINFGDGSTITGDTLLPNTPIRHLYMKLGSYRFTVTSRRLGSCVVMFVGEFVNLKIPVSGIGGPAAGLQNGCIPIVVPFKNTSSAASGETTFTWDFGDGINEVYDTSNVGDSIYHTYEISLCGIMVSLRAENECGNSLSTWSSVNTYGKDNVSILPALSRLCYPDTTVTFTGNVQFNCYIGARKYYWDFGDGTNTGWITFGGASQTHHFPGHGSYTVTFKDSNICGISTPAKAKVHIYTRGDAAFSYGPSPFGCRPFTVNFTNLSTGDSTTHSWTFGDGSSSTQPNPSHTYLDSGLYTVRLVVSNPACPNSDTSLKIRVYREPEAGFDQINSGCQPLTVNYINTTHSTSPFARYYWELGNGTTTTLKNPAPVVFNTPGTYTVRLFVMDTCGSDTFTRLFSVFGKPDAKFWNDSVCQGNPTNFHNQSTIKLFSGYINYYLWLFGNGFAANQVSPSYTYANSGKYMAQLIIGSSLGCWDTLSDSVIIYDKPNASFSALPGFNVCDTNRLQFFTTAQNTSQVDSFIWNFGDGNIATGNDTVSHHYSNGTYHVKLRLKSTFGCVDTMSRIATIYSSPRGDFISDTICLYADSTSFSDRSSTVNGEKISNWCWDFNLDSIRDDYRQNPKYLFNKSGSSLVKLIIMTEFGCYDTIYKPAFIYNIPLILFSANDSDICLGDSIRLYNHSTLADSFIWDFGDGSPLLSKKDTMPVSHKFDSSGTFKVKLTAFNEHKCTSSDSVEINVRALPFALFSSNDTVGCPPFIINFDNNSLNSSTYKWYADGILTGRQINRPDTIMMLANDSVYFSLIAYSQYGCRPDTFIQKYRTYDNPHPGFTPDVSKGCGPLTVNFSNTSLNSRYYIWNYGDGSSGNLVNPVHTFQPSVTKDTLYIITLFSYSAISCIDSIKDTIRVFPIPLSDFSLSDSNSCAPGKSVIFYNHSIPYDTGSINDMTFFWNFGNGSTSSGRDTSVYFIDSKTQDSIYTISLVAFSEHGCPDTSVKQFRVFPFPTVHFLPDHMDGCPPLTVNFSNTSQPNNGGSINLMTFYWNFGNGDSSTDVNPTDTFLASMTMDTLYKIFLTGYSEHHCSDTDSTVIRVYPKPAASFSTDPDNGCGPLNISFTNNSVPFDTGTINDMHFSWDFNNGITSAARDTSILFSRSNYIDTIYNIRLIAYNEHNCPDTVNQSVMVFTYPYVNFNSSNTDSCGPFPVYFHNTSYSKITSNNARMSFIWDYGNGITTTCLDTVITFIANLKRDTVYTVKLIGIDDRGCSDSAFHDVRVFPNPSVGFVADHYTGCGPLLCNFNNISIPNDTGSILNMLFRWDFGNGDYSLNVNETELFVSSHTKDTFYKVILHGTSEHGCPDNDTQFIRVYPVPVSSFKVLPDSGCGPLPVSVTNYSYPCDTGTINDMTFQWLFSDSTTSNQVNIFKTFYPSKIQNLTRYITLLAYSEHGCVDTSQKSIYIFVKPDVDFYQSAFSGCSPSNISFINLSIPHDVFTVNDMNFSWDFGNGIGSHAKDTSVTYFSGLTRDSVFHISLYGSTPNGCLDTAYSMLTIHPDPVANFSFPSENCKGNIIFNNNSVSNSISNIMGYKWYFGNLSTSSQVSDTVYFPSSLYHDTLFKVTLIATNSFGCIDTNTKDIVISPTPTAAFVASPAIGCGQFNVSYTNQSRFADSSFWFFGDGSNSMILSPNHTFNNTGNQIINFKTKLIVKSQHNCPSDTVSRVIVSHPNPMASFTNSIDSVCSPVKVYFSNSSSFADSFFWSVFNNQFYKSLHTNYTYPENNRTDTVYRVTLIAKSNLGCADTFTRNITIFSKPLALFSMNPDSGCTDLAVSFTNQSVGGNHYFWDFFDGKNTTATNPVHTFYNLSAIDQTFYTQLTTFSNHNCSDTLKRSIRVFTKPTVSFNMDKVQGCSPLTVRFTNRSTISTDSFNWNFGNGITGHTKDTVITFYAVHDTTYIITLIGFTDDYCSDTFTRQVDIFARPLANFSFPDTNCGNTYIPFINTSLSNNGGDINSINFLWQFGSIRNSTLKDESVSFKPSFSQDSVYVITLMATNSMGCKDTTVKSIIIHPKPTIRFIATPLESCGSITVNYRNLSILEDSITWFFGDGNFSHTDSVAHTFNNLTANSLTFTTRLIGITEYGCPGDTAKQNIILRPYPDANFSTTIDTGCSPLNVTFTNLSTNADSFKWQLTGSIIRNTKNTSYSFPGSIYNDTTYPVRLIARTNLGCRDTFIKNIRVYRTPVARFSVNQDSGCSPLTVQFTNSSTGASGYFWEFNDGDTSLQTNPVHVYNNLHITHTFHFNSTLYLTSKHGCRDTFIRPIVVFPNPIINFSTNKSTGCSPLNVTFTNNSVGTATDFYWDFGNGITRHLTDTSMTYFAPLTHDTTYRIMLIGSSTNHCKDTAYGLIRALSLPVAGFEFPDTICGNLNIPFTNTSIPNDSGTIAGMGFFWTFGTFKVSYMQNEKTAFLPSYYRDTIYPVTLFTTNRFGCKDTIAKNVLVHRKPNIKFNAAPLNNCGKFDVTFTNSSVNADTFHWFFGDGTVSNANNPVHTYINNTNNAINFQAKLAGVSRFGCYGDTAFRIINAQPVPFADFVTNIDTGCGPLFVSFANNSLNASSSHWDIEKGITSSSKNITHYFQASNYSDTVYRVRLIVRSTLGCSDTMIKNITVYRKPIAAFNTVPSSGCTPLGVNFMNYSQGSTGYYWNFGNGITSTDKDPYRIFNNYQVNDQVFLISLIAISPHGCSDSANSSITVNPRPVALYTMDKKIGCDPLQVSFFDNSLNGLSSYWDFGNGHNSNVINPVEIFHGGLTDSTYNVRLISTGNGGCADTFINQVVVYKRVIAFFDKSAIGCNPLTVNFRDSSTNASFWVWEFGDGSISTDKNPTHTFKNTGVYSVRLQAFSVAGCSSTFTLNNIINVITTPTVNFTVDKYYSELPNTTFMFTSQSNSAFKHSWKFGDGGTSNQLNPTHTYGDSGTYYITLTANNGYCEDSFINRIIIVSPIPEPDFDFTPTSGCVPHTVHFTEKSAYTESFMWYFGDGGTSNDANPVYTYSNAGIYTVTLIGHNVRGSGSITKSRIVNVYPKPFVDFMVDPSVIYLPNAQIQFINLSHGNNKYYWYLNDHFIDTSKNPFLTIYDPGKYSVLLIAVNEYNCSDSIEKMNIFRVDSAGIVSVPSAFTPNGDERNDLFMPVGYGFYPGLKYGSGNPGDPDYDPRLDKNSPLYDPNYKPEGKEYHFIIYDRWGEKVFETNNFREGWNGKYKGVTAETGVYYWIVTVNMYSGKVEKIDGTVTLLR